ncbi:MAG: hypothetical protein PUG60_04750 [Lachnospiraceae bacterium]|nr:hypothetical protein [Lachnospiraceae bacterium]MDY4971208.1 hypothetical protein [Lachnospiraceae bacterium]
MTESEREKLFGYDKKYLSLGITEGGACRTSVSVPWERTGNAFNMRIPNIYFAREDFDDPEILEQLKKFCITGCYIFTPLQDYDFLAQFTEIRDLYIEYGGAIRNLSFMRNMKEWFLLYLEDAHLENLCDLFPEDRENYPLASRCMGFYHCQVDDVSAMQGKKIFLSELLVWPAEPDPEEKEKWRKAAKEARAGRFRYYM